MRMNEHIRKQGSRTIHFFDAMRSLLATAATGALILSIGCASAQKVQTIKHDEVKGSSAAALAKPQSSPEGPASAANPAVLQQTGSPGVPQGTVAPDAGKSAQEKPAGNALSGKPENSGQQQNTDNAEMKNALMRDIREALMASMKSELTSSAPSADLKAFGEELSSEVRNELLRELWLAKQEIKETVRQQLKSEVTASVIENLNEREEQLKTDMHNDALRSLWDVRQEFGRFRFSGDLRLRYEGDYYDSNNVPDYGVPSDPWTLANDTVNSQRFKYRVRFEVDAKVNDKIDAILRLSTGTTSNPVSNNTTMGDYWNKDSVVFDQAYIVWRLRPALTLFAGRMANPWFYTDLVWSNNLSFEGFALKGITRLTDATTAYLTAGAFPLQQNDFTQHGKWLYAGQTGVEKKESKGISSKLGIAYYAFSNITGVKNDPSDASNSNNWTAPLFMQKGNTTFDISTDNSRRLALAAHFRELNVTGTFDIGMWDPVHVIFLADYVRNLGFKKYDVDMNRGATDTIVNINGYQVGLSVGHLHTLERGAWKTYFYVKYLGADAVVDAFTDTDFHLGGTNAKGWILGADYGLATNTWMTVKWMTANEIDGPPLAIDVLQVDLNVKF